MRAKELKCARRLENAVEQLDAAAAKEAARFLALIEKGESGDWVDEFLEWRRSFEHGPAAAKTMEAFRKLKADHDPQAESLVAEGWMAFRERDRELGRQKYEEVLEKYFAAGMYPFVKRWLAGMD